MTIRKTKPEDLDRVMEIFDIARKFLRKSGNNIQWTNGYPSLEIIVNDMKHGNSYVCEEDGGIIATFGFIIGNDPTYARIDDGKWLNEEPYGVIHRIASSGQRKGIATECLNWCYSQHPNIRIDTHAVNKVMIGILERLGYQRCGIIYVYDGTPREAFQKCER